MIRDHTYRELVVVDVTPICLESGAVPGSIQTKLAFPTTRSQVNGFMGVERRDDDTRRNQGQKPNRGTLDRTPS